MLLRVRVALPDRPGSLGQVARTLGVAGADIVQVVVLERLGGRAVDDFTVVWPGGSGVERLRAGLAAMPGVRVDGIWRAIGAPVGGGFDAELLTRVATNPEDGIAILVDAIPALLAADWAAVLSVPSDWPSRRPEPTVIYASWKAPEDPRVPEIAPLRPRAMSGPDGSRFAMAPFGKDGLVLAVARTADTDLPVAAFHGTEVDRIAQLVRATSVIVNRPDLISITPGNDVVTAGVQA
jgi:hypothetical protein